MTTDSNILREMLERATNPNRETADELGVQMFCMVAKNNVSIAQDMIVSKIQSDSEIEATRAIALLEECMAKCGAEFQDKVDKFRFLNELIRLVSRKHMGPFTPPAIKLRIMDCLLLWTTAFPQLTKIREAYDSLNKESCDNGNNERTSTNVTAAAASNNPHPENIFGKDEALLKQLLKTNDLKRANLLIQYRVRQHERHTNFLVELKKELMEVENIVLLLNQMLGTLEEEGIAAISSESITIMQELFLTCKRKKLILQRLLDMKDFGVAKTVSEETLLTNHSLLLVLKRFKDSVIYRQLSNNKDITPTTPQTSTSVQPEKSSTDVLADLLQINTVPIASSLLTNGNSPKAGGSLLPQPSTTTNEAPPSGNANEKTLEELHAIFGSLNEKELGVTTHNTSMASTSFDCLKPVNVFALDEERKGDVSPTRERPRRFRELREIDDLSEQLFKQSLAESERLVSFKRDIEKITLNDLAIEAKHNMIADVDNPNTMHSQNFENLQPAINTTVPIPIDDDGILEDEDNKMENLNELSSETGNNEKTEMPVIHLSQIELNFDDIVPTNEERVLLDDDDIKLTLNFTENRPSRQVSVIVVAMVNKSKMHIKDFQFEASVKKPSKIRLLPPTETSMPPFKTFRPPTPINQVMLVLNPTGKMVNITCIVGYKIGDDPDPIKESIVADNIPYVEC